MVHSIRRLTHLVHCDNTKQVAYPTFDDGPFESSTYKLLELMDTYQVKGTFFVVANRGRSNKSLLREIKDLGHSIGNHSLDHQYRHYFLGKKKLLAWISESEMILQDIIGDKTIGFRPPNGIQTPELHWVLQFLDMPLILWNQRFYDGLIPLTISRVQKKIVKIQKGSIILLHEKRIWQETDSEFKAMEFFLKELTSKNFFLRAITQNLIRNER